VKRVVAEGAKNEGFLFVAQSRLRPVHELREVKKKGGLDPVFVGLGLCAGEGGSGEGIGHTDYNENR
jgi:hypothetical protein